MEKFDFAVLILAAGSSQRLGTPKQLLEYQGKTLLELAAHQALELTSNVYAVLGHQHKQCESALKGIVTTLINPHYQEGIGSSIAYGVSRVAQYGHLLIMLCDQPLIPSHHYRSLIHESQANPSLIVASQYDSKPGVPALFPLKYYPLLQALTDNNGAKPLLISNPGPLVPIDDSYVLDIDTIQDWQNFLQKKSF